MRLLLINPRFPESFWSFRWALEELLPGKRTLNPPLGLATLAALCPPNWQVEIVDENVEPVPLEPEADLIGICGMGVQYPRQKELLGHYRGRGYRTVAGGSYASLCPEKYAALADTVVAGEAEYIWPQFCRDFEAGAPQPFYRESGTVDLADSPTPRFDLLKLENYTSVAMQFSRGCPYRCEFCDIIVMFGRKPRTKSLPQVGRELDALRALGKHSVFFVDDNLIGHKAVAKDLLRYLADYQRRHDYAFTFGTEASINLAQDEELMALFRAANFTWVFIGIESPDPESLKETHKTQNLQEDLLTSVRRIYAHGIDVLAGFIVGFDNDTLETFELQYRFIMDSGIQTAMVGLLTALPRTPLYERLKREGRLIAEAGDTDNTKLGTNFIPKRMSYDAMVDAYRALYRRLQSDRGIADRIRNKLRYLAVPPYRSEFSLTQRAGIVARLLAKGILPGGWPRIYHFLRTVPFLAPAKFPEVVVEWITGLTMLDYVCRHFDLAPMKNRVERLVAATREVIAAYLNEGRATLSLRYAAVPHLSLSLEGLLDRKFFRRTARHLVRILKQTPSLVTLRIEALPSQESRHVQRLLKRLRRYGDRIYIEIDEKIRPRLAIDTSIFHLVPSHAGDYGPRA